MTAPYWPLFWLGYAVGFVFGVLWCNWRDKVAERRARRVLDAKLGQRWKGGEV